MRADILNRLINLNKTIRDNNEPFIIIINQKKDNWEIVENYTTPRGSIKTIKKYVDDYNEFIKTTKDNTTIIINDVADD